jgi:modification methylase
VFGNIEDTNAPIARLVPRRALTLRKTAPALLRSTTPPPPPRPAAQATEDEDEPSTVNEDELLARWTGKVHCGDCVELMSKMPAQSVGLIVTSPQYNLRNSTGNGMKNGSGGKWASAQLLKGYDTNDDNMPREDYVRQQRNCLSPMMRVLRSDGAIFYVHKERVQAGLIQDPADILKDFPLRQRIIWQRAGHLNFNRGYFLPTYEVIYLICNRPFKLAPKANAQGAVWKIIQERNNPHPAPFPVELARRCIASTTAQIVLDPFLGSGTTAIAAELRGRKWIGCEISKDYCEMARARIEAHRRLMRGQT